MISNGRMSLRVLVIVWMLCWAGSFLVFWLVQPTGDGFIAGMNRVTWAVLLQLIAVAIAVICLAVSRAMPIDSRWRNWGWWPLGGSALTAGFASMAVAVAFVLTPA